MKPGRQGLAGRSGGFPGEMQVMCTGFILGPEDRRLSTEERAADQPQLQFKVMGVKLQNSPLLKASCVAASPTQANCWTPFLCEVLELGTSQPYSEGKSEESLSGNLNVTWCPKSGDGHAC